MAVGLWRRVVAVGALVGVAATMAACSGPAQPGGRAGANAPSSQPGAGSAATGPTTSAPRTSITVVAPPTGSSVSGGPVVSTGQTSPNALAGSGGASTDPSTPQQPPAPAATVTASPALGSTGIAPAAKISITVRNGRLSWLTVTTPEGKKVTGSLSADHTTWTLGERLGYGKTYTVTGVAVNAAGTQTKIDSSYRTATTVEPVTTSISPGNGAVVGVAAPVIVSFGMNPQDKALIERNVTITTTPKVEGAWAWITHDGDSYPSLDWRPKSYWPAGTKVHVESNIYGVKFADGWYGGDDAAVDFTIGRNQVVIANAKTHRMTVERDGKVVAVYDASLGMGDDPNSEYGLRPSLVTRSGIHIVMDKQPKVLMSNPGYYKDAPEYWAVRISDNGEFIHYNAGTTSWQLGHVNKTHGCINLSEDNAKAYYASAIYGDPVDVVGTSVKLSPSDGDIYDWAIPWPTWLTLSALSANSTVG